MYRKCSRVTFFLLVLITYIEITETNSSFLSCFFLAKNIFKYNNLFDCSSNI